LLQFFHAHLLQSLLRERRHGRVIVPAIKVITVSAIIRVRSVINSLLGNDACHHCKAIRSHDHKYHGETEMNPA
jgi:hypothetical protein